VSPHNPDKIYIAGVPVLRSEDAGKTWKNINGDNVHVDHHALWVNPNRRGSGFVYVKMPKGTKPTGMELLVPVENLETRTMSNIKVQL